MRTFIPCLSAPPPPPPPPVRASHPPASHFCLAAHLRFFARVRVSERAFERTVTDSSERLILDKSRQPLGIGLIAAL